MQRKLSEGNILTQILLFAFPILVGNTLQRLYTLADTIMVGRLLGTQELAAVGASSVIANFFNDICNSFTNGMAIIIAQYFGAEDERQMKKSMAGTYTVAFILAVTLTTAGLLLIKPMLFATSAPLEIFNDASGYLRIMTGGLIAILLYNCLANILRATGDSIVPLIFLAISVTLNIVLDYSFIAISKLGVKGAASATILSQGIAGTGCLIFCIFKRKTLLVKKEDFKDNKKIFGQILPQGFSMCFMLSVVSLSTVILQKGINSLGSEYIAGYLSGRKYLELLMMPGFAISMTAAPFVSQNFGARKPDRIKKGVLCLYELGWIWDAVATIIVFTLGRSMITSVTGKTASEEIIKSGILYLRIGAPMMFPLTVLVVTRSSLQGMNHKKTPALSSLIELAVKILSVIIIVPSLGFLGICITEPIIWLLGAIYMFVVYKKLTKELIQE